MSRIFTRSFSHRLQQASAASGSSPFSAWIYRIVTNICKGHLYLQEADINAGTFRAKLSSGHAAQTGSAG